MRILPTLRSVNLLYLIALILVVVIGSVVQAISPTWGLIITEVFLILLPGLIFLKVLRLPLQETTQLRWPGYRLAGLSVLIGAGFALLAYWLGVVVTELFGYTFSVPPEFYPKTALQAVVIFSALAIFAPVCEEFLFRGIIQRGYERRGARAAILIVGLYFAIYHLSFQRALAIIPVALVLGYAAWRSRSLFSSILVHSSYNALSGILLLISSFRPDINLNLFGTLPVAAVGLVLAVLALWVFRQESIQAIGEGSGPPGWISSDTVSETIHPPESSSTLGRSWPIAVSLLIILVMAGLELLVGAFPQVLALGRLQFNPGALPGRATWSYELRNVLDEPVGTASCTLSPSGEDFALDCRVHQSAFEATLGSSYYKTGAYELQQTAVWRGRDLHLLEAQGEQIGDPAGLSWTVANGALTTDDGREVYEPVPLPPGALLEHEWPWKLQALPFSLGYSQKAPLAWPLRWSEAVQASVPQVEETLLVVRGAEPLWTPAGNFIAWVVTIGDDQTAWYDSETPHTLLKYDNGMVTYLLTDVE